MKKCIAIIFYSALFFLFSCTGKHNGCNNVNTPSGIGEEVTAMSINDTIKIHENYSYAYSGEDAPALTVDISLPIVELKDVAASARIDSALAMTLFGESTTLRDACDMFVDSRKKDFDEMHDEYINSKDNDTPAFFFSLYDIIGATAQVGYKECITYIAVHEEYNGGAHPNTFISITNFDPNSGNEITLNDIFKEGYEEQLIAILTEQLMKENNAATIEELRDQGFLLFDTEMFISNNFALEKESITFLYNPYEIACYAMGHIYVTLDYKSLEEIMK
jgi:hypothetical protein